MRQIECAYSKCDFETRNLIIEKVLYCVTLSGTAGFLPVILSGAKRGRRISTENKDDIYIEIPRGARDDGARLLFCVTLSEPPRRNGGESNGSLLRRTMVGYSSCC